MMKTIEHDDTSVYWISGAGTTAGLWTAPQTGGPNTHLASFFSQVDIERTMLVDDTTIYISNGESPPSGGLIWSVPKSGGSLSLLNPQFIYYPTALAVDGDYLYWTDSAMVVNRMAKTGGPVTAIATGENAIGIALDETNAYWIDRTNQRLRRWNKGSGATDTIATSITGTLLRSDAASFFIADSEGTIVSVPKVGGSPTTLVAAPLEKFIYAMTIGTNEIYWSSSTLTTGVTHIWAISKDGTGLRALSADRANGVTATPNGVFWTNDTSEVKELCN